jgi:type I restriction enzyme S subunit
LSRGTLGNVALYTADTPFKVVRINSGMFILRRYDSAFWPQYLALVLRSPLIRTQIAALQSGTAQPQLPIREFREFKVPVPPLSEQEQIVSEVDRRLSVVEEVEASVAANLQRAGRLRQAVLQRAFCLNSD